VESIIRYRVAGAGSCASTGPLTPAPGSSESPRIGCPVSPGKPLLLLALLLLPFTARAEDCRYGHGSAEVTARSPTRGCLGRGCVLIDKAQRWVVKLPCVVQDEAFEPRNIVFPEFPIEDFQDPCLIYWDVYIPVGAQAVWHVHYAGELFRENGIWRIRYYSTATLHPVTA
jgi:hypothetical protein